MHERDVIEAHDRGLRHDLKVLAERAAQRRRLLGLLAAGGTATPLGACGSGESESSGAAGADTDTSTGTGTGTGSGTGTGTDTGTGTGTDTTPSSCIADPQETNGPYPADGTNTINGTLSNVLTSSGIVRSDIRTSFGGYVGTAEGVPLVLTLKLVNTNARCAALQGYAIYVWHCDRSGNYSLYSSGVQNQNYLRGVQVTDANGEVTFTTIYPACYSGRWPHIHFEVFSSLAVATTQRNALLTSQLAMPAALNSAVFNQVSGYSASLRNYAQISLANDNVFGDNSSDEIVAMTPTLAGSIANGFTGTVVVGVAR